MKSTYRKVVKSRAEADAEKVDLLMTIKADVEKAYSLSRDMSVNNILSRAISNI